MKVERIIFFQGDSANEYLDLLDRKGERAVVKQLMEYWDPGHHDMAKELSAGNSDHQEAIKVNGIEFILTYNTGLNYIGLEHVIPTKYYLIKDSIDSHITTVSPNSSRVFEEFDSFIKAKKALVNIHKALTEEVKDMYEEYREALRVARALTKTDFEEEE